MQAQDIIHFWFDELTDAQRFAKDAALDAALRERFGSTLQAALRGELFDWRVTPLGRLAEIVVLDQFSRNIYRDTPAAFAQDPQALTLAQELVASGQDQTPSIRMGMTARSMRIGARMLGAYWAIVSAWPPSSGTSWPEAMRPIMSCSRPRSPRNWSAGTLG